jgi:hypothetical protein
LDLCPLQGAPHPASFRQLLALPFSYYGLTLFRLEKQAARRGADNTAAGLTQANRGNQMAQADSDTTTELTLRLHLHKAGLRLRSSGVSYEILLGNQILLSGNAHGEALSIDDVANYLRRSLVRP